MCLSCLLCARRFVVGCVELDWVVGRVGLWVQTPKLSPRDGLGWVNRSPQSAIRSIRHSVPATTFQTLIVSLVLSRLECWTTEMPSWPVFLLTCSGVFSRWWTRQHVSSTACVTPTTSPTHSSASIGRLAPGSGVSTVQDGRAHVQGHSWNRAVIPESTGSCRWSAWSTFPPLCSDQSSAGAVRETVYRRRPSLPSRRTHHLEQPAGQCDICPVSVNLPSAFKTFLFQASFTGNIIDPGKLFHVSSGSWSDFITWTTLKIHDWLID